MNDPVGIAGYDELLTLLEQGQYASALLVLTRVYNELPEQAGALVAIGRILAERGKTENARRCFHLSLDLVPDTFTAHLELARLELSGPSYLEALAQIHACLKPFTYVEVGVRSGASFLLSGTETIAVGIDPEPSIDERLLARHQKIVLDTSDSYFNSGRLSDDLGGQPVDLAFIDGMHLFEFVLRDFIALEKYCHPQSIILLHDCYPLNELTARRSRETAFWSGDVWKVILCLKENRPDLVIETLPCPPTGLTVVRGLDPTSRFLSKHLEKMCGRYRSLDYSVIEQQKKQKLNLIDMNEGIVGAFDKGAFLKSRYKAMMFLPFQINHRTREKFSIKTDRSEHRFYGFDSMEPYSEILQLKKTTPGFVRRDDAIYFPSQNDPPIDSESGLCDGGGNVIMESCLFRGQDSSEKVTELKCFVGVTERRRLEGNYIYGGFLDPHYGHFLTETMGRLWILLNEPQAGSFLLFHGDLSTLKLDFVKTILDFLPIENDKIIVLDHVVELEKVTIPLPSMVNRGAIHTIHKKLPVEVAQKFLGSQNFRRTEQPLYLSRRKLSKNIRHIQNEHVFEKYLESKNVKIVYPEELPFAEQVLLFNRHKVVIGPFGSAHHTSMFSLKPLTAVYLCHPGTLSNYLMTDYISHSSSHYILCCQVDLQYKRPLYLSSQILDVDYALSCLKRIGIV